jgi:hypothetical protein
VRADARKRAESRLDFLKGRIAEALVEMMFRRAGYAVSRTGRESQVQRLFKSGRDEFLPDFMIRRAVERPGSERPLHQLIPIEVKYRRDIERFLHVEAADFRVHSRKWPGLYLVLVTENPDQGRSCFQVLDGDGEATGTADLHGVRALDIFDTTVLEYEELGRKLFRLLSEHRSAIGHVGPAPLSSF